MPQVNEFNILHLLGTEKLGRGASIGCRNRNTLVEAIRDVEYVSPGALGAAHLAAINIFIAWLIYSTGRHLATIT